MYKMTGLKPGRTVAEPDQQPLISKGFEGESAGLSDFQLIRSLETE